MKTMRLLVLCALSVSPFAQATEDPVADAHSFTSSATLLRAQLSSPGNYDGVSAPDRKAIDADLSQTQRLLEHYGQTSQLNTQHAVAYFNAQEHLNGLLAGDLGSRYRCMLFAHGSIVCRMYSLTTTSRGVSAGASDAELRSGLMGRQVTRPVDLPHYSGSSSYSSSSHSRP